MRFFFLFLLMTATVTADLTGEEEEEGECGGELTESQGSVESPGYPQSAEEEGARYPDNADCHWTLAGGEKTLVRVKIYDIAIELGEGGSNSTCEFDSLDIELGSKGRKSFCGVGTARARKLRPTTVAATAPAHGKRVSPRHHNNPTTSLLPNGTFVTSETQLQKIYGQLQRSYLYQPKKGVVSSTSFSYNMDEGNF